MNRFAVVLGAIGLALCVMWVFPGLAYVSIASFGAPAAAFVLLGYGTWRLLKTRAPAFAEPFLIAFATPVLFVLATMVFSVPLLVTSIIGPVAIAELLRRWPHKARST